MTCHSFLHCITCRIRALGHHMHCHANLTSASVTSIMYAGNAHAHFWVGGSIVLLWWSRKRTRNARVTCIPSTNASYLSITLDLPFTVNEMAFCNTLWQKCSFCSACLAQTCKCENVISRYVQKCNNVTWNEDFYSLIWYWKLRKPLYYNTFVHFSQLNFQLFKKCCFYT